MILTGKTDIGRRKRNEDSYLILQKDRFSIAAVSDGMGGHAAGETASRICVETLNDCFSAPPIPAESDLIDAFYLANSAVWDAAAADDALLGMGATLVAAVLFPDRFLAANVGDSRLYLYHDRTLSQITHDHSFVAELVRAKAITPEEAKTHPNRNIVMRAIGTDSRVKTDVFSCTWEPGDILLLCSDGLCGTLSDTELTDVLNHTGDLDIACSILIERALAGGSTDNITVVLAKNTEANA